MERLIIDRFRKCWFRQTAVDEGWLVYEEASLSEGDVACFTTFAKIEVNSELTIARFWLESPDGLPDFTRTIYTQKEKD